MNVRQKLARIPRPIVHLVPRRLRDRLRTALLVRERERPAQKRNTAEPTVVTHTAKMTPEVAARLDTIESKLDAVLTRFTDLSAGIEQLDARISQNASGTAPSVADDIRELLAPIEELSEQLRGASEDEPELRAAERRHAAS